MTRPVWLLRMEEGALLVAAIVLYAHMHFSWVLFGVLFLTPDLFMLGYVFNVRLGAGMYNAGHFLLGPLVVAGVSLWLGWGVGLAVAIIWFSHISFDRALGYGFKYPTTFQDTHLQHLG